RLDDRAEIRPEPRVGLAGLHLRAADLDGQQPGRVRYLLGKVDLEVADDLAALVAPPPDGRQIRILHGVTGKPQQIVEGQRVPIPQEPSYHVATALRWRVARSRKSRRPHGPPPRAHSRIAVCSRSSSAGVSACAA